MSSPITKLPLPEYADPPVVETVLGVQFERLPVFTNAHLGAFWKSLDQKEWIEVADAPAVPPQFERFSEAAKWARGVSLQLTPIAPGRIQIKNAAGDRMLQLQNGRLHFNWLGGTGTQYPRYEAVRKGFATSYEWLDAFIREGKLGELRANQWEVTYINQIPQGSVWQTVDDWKFFLPLRGVPTVDGTIVGEDFEGQWHFVIPPQRGRLHIQWQHALSALPDKPEQEIVQMTLTARGPLAGDVEGFQAVLDGLDLGREAIVKAFEALMSKEANQRWGLTNAND